MTKITELKTARKPKGADALILQQMKKQAQTQEDTAARLELEEMRAELEKTRAENAALRIQVETAPSGKRAIWLQSAPEDKLADPETTLGKAQRLPREEFLAVVQRAIRAMSHADVQTTFPALILDAVKGGGYDGKQNAEALTLKLLKKKVGTNV